MVQIGVGRLDAVFFFHRFCQCHFSKIVGSICLQQKPKVSPETPLLSSLLSRLSYIALEWDTSPTALVVTWLLHFSSGISPNAPGLHSVQIPFFCGLGPKRNRYVKWQNMFNPYLFFIQQKNYTKVGWDNSVIHLLQTWQSLLSKILWAFNVSTTKRRRKQCSLSSSRGKQVTNKCWYQTPMNSITISGIFLAQ